MVASVAREDCMFAIGHVLHETYRIERLLGQGGMASVFEVAHARLPRRFALKIITAHDAQSAEYMLRFRREAEILASLDHPNLVNVIDWNITPAGQPYLVMEFLSGEDLAHLLHRSGALPLKVALSIFAQAAAALEVAHSHGITHRDLKPANIFLCKNGLVPHYTKVLDFGIAKSARHSQALVTDHLVLMGTPAYMAPEQARGDSGGVDARSDQFSLAIVLYEMLAGKSAFYRRGEPAMTTLCRILTEDPPPLPDAPMNQAVMRALRKDPDERYPSLAEMVAAVMNASSVPLELIEIPERTDPITVRKLGSSGGAAAPELRRAAPAVAPRNVAAAPLPEDGPLSTTTAPTDGAPSYPPPS
ncbi:MAG TPA: serine/threonine-protein kinase, partial [Pseudomonadota bacterium]|nr:serine/threonine-protein kinase [Pseudomonadota bacterium]